MSRSAHKLYALQQRTGVIEDEAQECRRSEDCTCEQG